MLVKNLKNLKRDVKQYVKSVIAVDIQYLPNGYHFWHTLPSKGRKSQDACVNRWTSAICKMIFNDKLRQTMLLACLDNNGLVEDKGNGLYQWLVHNLYGGQERELYKEWTTLQRVK